MLNVLDEFSHECLAIRVARKLTAIDVITWTLSGADHYRERNWLDKKKAALGRLPA